MFLNRQEELAQLQRWWGGDAPELITLYGRRQVGKTDLLVRFLADKPAIYFYADRQVLADHLRAFTQQVLALSDDPVLRLQPFSSWEAALIYVLRLAQDRRLAIVLDEFSYAVDADPALPSVLQRLWDTTRRGSSYAFVILCTSFTEAVERHFAIDGPLYRRRTRQMPVLPFSYRESSLFFPQWPAADRLRAWGIVGGVPSYLAAFRGGDVATATIDMVLDKSAVLYTEADTLLAQEVRGVGPAVLRGILGAIAYGCTVPNEIAQRVGRPVTSLSGALRFLVDFGLIERRVPYTVPNAERTRQTRYVLADNYLAFWFRFVLPNRSALEQGQRAYVWDTKIRPQLDAYMGPRFEVACRQFIQATPTAWRHAIPELGVWWDTHDELEVVGHDGGLVVLAAEVKWTNDPMGLAELRLLERRVARLPHVAPDRQLALFSRSGFTAEVVAQRSSDLVLVTLDDLLA
jgi:AAA+ ATPase superfamily predicted ATPase